MAYASSHREQPGLEVSRRPDDYSGLQVAPSPPQYKEPLQPTKAEDDHGKEVTSASSRESSTEKGSKPLAQGNKKRKIGLFALACLLVVIGVVVGAVVGTVGKRSGLANDGPGSTDIGSTGDEPGGTDTGSSGAEMTGSPSTVAPGLYPTAVSCGYPHLEIYALTNNRSSSIYRKYRNSSATSDNHFVPGGTAMELVGGNIDLETSPSIAVSHRWALNSMNWTIVSTKADDGLSHRKHHFGDQLWLPSNPASWDTWGDKVQSAPATVRYGSLTEVVTTFYVMNGDQGLAAYYYKYHDEGGWSPRKQVAGPDLQPMAPAVVAWNGDDTRLDLFAVSRANNHLLHAFWEAETDRWSAYEDLRGFVTTPPTAVSRRPETLDVFARGGDGGLWHLAFGGGGWSNWTRISGGTAIRGQPDAISVTSDRVDVFAWGRGREMLHKSSSASSGSWEPQDGFEVLVDGGLSGPPRSTSDAPRYIYGPDSYGRDEPGQIHVFAYDAQNRLIWKTLDTAAGTSSSGDVVTLADVPFV